MTGRRHLGQALALLGALVVPAGATAEPDDDRRAAAVIEAWSRTEDAGDLPAYEGLLAPGFHSTTGPGGLGAVGRAAWLAGVRSRFEVRARLGTDVPEVVRHGGVAVARVGLVRSAGPRREAGETWLWLAAGPDGWQVAGAEEGLATARRQRGRGPQDDLPLRLVVDAGAPYVLLAAARTEHLALDPEAALSEPAGGWRAWPQVAPGEDAEQGAWYGRWVVLHDAAGPLCRGLAEQVTVLVREPAGVDGAAAPATGLEFARVWSGAPGGGAAFLALRVRPEAGDPCRGALWAHLDDAPPERLGPWSVPPELRRAGLVALRKLPAYRAATRAYEAAAVPVGGRLRRGAHRPRWELAPEARLDVRGFGPASDGTRWLAVSAVAPGETGVGAAALWQVFGEGTREPHLVLISNADGPARPFVPEVAVRLTGARDPAFLGGGRVLAPGGRWLREAVDASPPLYALPSRRGSTTSNASDTLRPRKRPRVPQRLATRKRSPGPAPTLLVSQNARGVPRVGESSPCQTTTIRTISSAAPPSRPTKASAPARERWPATPRPRYRPRSA